MKKKIMNEKIKYFSTLIKEKSETKNNKTYLSNFELISNFNFNDSSFVDKSNFLTNNETNLFISKVRQSDNYDNIYSSIILKENNVIGHINNIKPKFFTKDNLK